MPPGPLTCFVEIPMGSRNKYAWDDALQGIKLARLLFSSVVSPTDYGFLPDTLGLDGDHLDAMVCVSAPTFPGCGIRVEPIALLRMEDRSGQDDTVPCVPKDDPGWSGLETLEDLPESMQEAITHVFSIYKGLDRAGVGVRGWHSREDALEEIDASFARHRERAGE